MAVMLADPLLVSWLDAKETSLLSISIIPEVWLLIVELEMNELDTVQQGCLLLSLTMIRGILFWVDSPVRCLSLWG